MTTTKNRRGFTLIESLAMVVLLALVAIALFSNAVGFIDSQRASSIASGIHRVLERSRIEARGSGPVWIEAREGEVVALAAQTRAHPVDDQSPSRVASVVLPPGYNVRLGGAHGSDWDGVRIDALGRSDDLVIEVTRADGSYAASWRVNGLTGQSHSFSRGPAI